MRFNFKDLTGNIFTRWTVLSYAGKNKYVQSLWDCVCACGNTKIVAGNSLQSRLSKSCGCLNKELASSRSKGNKYGKTHGFKAHFLYKTWLGINDRGLNKNSKDYTNYGARGITVCDEWKSTRYGGLDNQQGFTHFLKRCREAAKEQGISWRKIEHLMNGKWRAYSLFQIISDGRHEQNNRRIEGPKSKTPI